jgi:hypothetical protein
MGVTQVTQESSILQLCKGDFVMKTVFKFAAPLFVLALLAVGVVGVAFAREAERFDGRSSEMEIYGTVDAITSSAWTIDGKVYPVTAATEIEGVIQVGAQVKVHLTPDASGALVIREVELAEANETNDDNSANEQDMDVDDSFDDHSQSQGEDSEHDGSDDSDGNESDDSDQDESDDSGQDLSDDDSDQDDDDDEHEDHSGDDDEDEHDDDDHDDDHGGENNDDD